MPEVRTVTPPEPPSKGRVAVLGEGALVDALLRAGGPLGRVAVRRSVEQLRRGSGEEYASAVVVSARADSGVHRAVHAHALKHRTSWLPVRTGDGWITVGPVTRPPDPGCPTCVQRRQELNRAETAALRELDADPGTPAATAGSAGAVIPVLAAAVARLVLAELAASADAAGRPRTDGAVLRVSVLDGSIRRHRFLPDPLCPRCSALPPDSAAAATWRPRPLPKRDPRDFRLRDLRTRTRALTELYVDAVTGVVASLSTAASGTATAVARLAPGQPGPDGRHGYGIAGDHDSARRLALLEALERRSGTLPRSRRTAVRASYNEVRGAAVDPRSLGTHAEDLHRLPGFPFARFDPDLSVNWVWAHSFARKAPVLVPETAVYHGMGPGWAQETSNGSALGSCLEEAALFGLLETAERDAFLMTWYARIPAPRVDLGTAVDRRIRTAEEQIRQRLGHEVMVFSTMLEQRVPAFLAVGVNRADRTRPAAAVSAAAHPLPERAVLSAVRELGSTLEGLAARFAPESAASLAADSALVKSMEDHAALYTSHDALPRLDFLLRQPPRTSLEEIAREARWPEHRDLTADLLELVDRHLAHGLDVLVVDTTTNEQAAGDLASAKVLVPGTLPMTFGHRFRRIDGLPRLARTPRLLGHRDRDLRPEDINTDPHPFL